MWGPDPENEPKPTQFFEIYDDNWNKIKKTENKTHIQLTIRV